MSMFLQQMAVSGGAVQSQNTWQSSGDSFGDGASLDTSHSLIADKGLLIALMSDNVSEKNLNNFGRFDGLKDSVDKTKAKAYFDKQDGVTLPPFKLNMRIEQFLKQFIFAKADDLLSDVVDVPDDAFE